MGCEIVQTGCMHTYKTHGMIVNTMHLSQCAIIHFPSCLFNSINYIFPKYEPYQHPIFVWLPSFNNKYKFYISYIKFLHFFKWFVFFYGHVWRSYCSFIGHSWRIWNLLLGMSVAICRRHIFSESSGSLPCAVNTIYENCNMWY